MRSATIALLIALAGLAAGPLRADCSPPVMTAVPGEEGGERQMIRAFFDFMLCNARQARDDPDRLRFPGDREMHDSVIAYLEAEIALLDRPMPLPSLDRRQAASAHNGNSARLSEWSRYGGLVQELELYRACRALGGDCDTFTEIESLRASGVDPEAEAARIARELRLTAPEPWFTLSHAFVMAGAQRERLDAAEREVRVAREAYGEALDAWDRGSHDEARRVQDAEAAVIAARHALLDAERQLGAGVSVADPAGGLAAAGAHATATLTLIEAEARAEALRAEAAARVEALDAGVSAAAQRLAAAAGALNRSIRDDRVQVRAIRAPNTLLTLVTPEEKETVRRAIDALDAEIAERRGRIEGLRRDWQAARAAHGAAVADSTEAGRDRLLASYASIMVQYYVELGAFVGDVARAGMTGGPGAALVEEARLIGLNALFPPTWYGVETPGVDAAMGGEEVEVGLPDPDVAAATQAVKEIASMPARALIRLEGEALARTAADEAASLMSVSPDAASWGRFARQEARALRTTRVLGRGLNRAGLRALARTMLSDAGQAVLAEATKEGLKIAASRLIESGAAEEMLVAELALRGTHQAKRAAGIAYQRNLDAIAVLRARRDRLSGLLGTGDLLAEAPGPFYPLPGTRFEVDLVPGTVSDVSRLDMALRLGPVTLERDAGTTAPVWVVPEDAVFDLNLPADLTLWVTIGGTTER